MDREAGSKAASVVLSRPKFYWQRYIKPFSPFTKVLGVQPIALRAA
jgi:hypothetical protein